jgi:hypothetical protein
MLNRRSWMKALGVAAAGYGLETSLQAALSCGPQIPPYGVQACIAGIPQEQMDTVEVAQEQSEWCWAACIEMVFTFWGHPIGQEQIVEQTWGQLVNMPAQPSQIIADLNRSWTDSNGRRFRSRGDVFSASAATAAQDLANGMPLILGSLGHAMVLTAISYNRAPSSQGQVTGAIVRDPWPGRGRRLLSAQEAASTMLLARIRVT